MSAVAPTPLSPEAIRTRVASMPGLPTLGSIREILVELVSAEEKSTTRLASVISRDPGLVTRLLQRVNSPEFGLTHKVKSLEDAVIHVGSRTVRDLAMMAPVVTDMRKVSGDSAASWRALWRHSAGTALLCRELLASAEMVGSDLEYLAGLVHDVGWIVIKRVFPEHFAEVERQLSATRTPVVELVERAVLGAPHNMVGGWYLASHGADEILVKAAMLHTVPEGGGSHGPVLAAVQIADQFMASIGCGHIGDPVPAMRDQWRSASGWQILFQPGTEAAMNSARRRLELSGPRLLALVDAVC